MIITIDLGSLALLDPKELGVRNSGPGCTPLFRHTEFNRTRAHSVSVSSSETRVGVVGPSYGCVLLSLSSCQKVVAAKVPNIRSHKQQTCLVRAKAVAMHRFSSDD